MSPSPGDFPDVVEVVVEIPRGSRNKYEYDEAAGVFRLDRVLASAVHYNFDYGFIEGTRSGDGDHTDALLLIDEPTFPGCRVWARPIGGLEMRDEKGFDFKVLCVAVGDPHQAHVEQLDQVRPHRLIEIEHFFETYKLLEAKDTEVLGWRDASRAHEVLGDDRATFLKESGKRGPTGQRRARSQRLTGPRRSPPPRRSVRHASRVRRDPARGACARGGRGPRRVGPVRGRPGGQGRPLGPARRSPPDAPVHRPGRGGSARAARRGPSTTAARPSTRST